MVLLANKMGAHVHEVVSIHTYKLTFYIQRYFTVSLYFFSFKSTDYHTRYLSGGVIIVIVLHMKLALAVNFFFFFLISETYVHEK